MLATAPLKMLRLTATLGVLAGAMALVAPLAIPGTLFPDAVVVDVTVFYGATAGAYAMLPFLRRGDIAMVAMWLVLAVDAAPSVVGRELSAAHMFAHMAGVAMAVLPIYIARRRQEAQGDTRPYHRRAGEPEGSTPSHASSNDPVAEKI